MPRLAKQKHDPHSLGNVLEDLNKIAADLQVLIESMKQNGLESVELRFHGEVLRALKFLPRFISDGNDEVRQKLIDSEQRYKPSVSRKSVAEMDQELKKSGPKKGKK